MYNQQSSSFYGSSAGSMGNQSSSQYRGNQNQKPFQPTGMVQSQYGQRQSQYGSNQNQSMSAGRMQSSAGGYQSTSSFHTANYRGNQPGHDSSRAPSQSGMSGIGSSYGTGAMSQSSYGLGQSGAGQAAGAGFQSTNSFHTAGYRGNQPGHDNYLRSVSQIPSQAQSGFTSSGMAQSQFQPQQSSYQQQNQFQQQIQQQNQFQNQNQNQSFASTQSFHTAGYRGNQPGHDAYLRSDSAQPVSSHSSIGGTSSFRF